MNAHECRECGKWICVDQVSEEAHHKCLCHEPCIKCGVSSIECHWDEDKAEKACPLSEDGDWTCIYE
jgi:hypothetical protein